jgi:hypothetical protein
VIDFAFWNQRRDALYPKGVANPKVIVNLPSTITPNAGARLYAVQESGRGRVSCAARSARSSARRSGSPRC